MDKTLSDAIAVASHYGLTDREIASAVEAATAAKRADAARPGLVAMQHEGLPDQLVDPDAVEVYERSGWTVVSAAEPEPDDDGLPKGNASREDWAAYALRHGLTEEDLAPPDREQLTRDEIRDHFTEES